MFLKLDEVNKVHYLKEGSIVVKYPLGDETRPTIDISNPTTFILYQVQYVSNDLSNITFTIPENKLPETITLFGFTTFGILNNPITCTQTVEEVIEDGRWWIWK